MPNRLISGNRSMTHDELRANALKIAQGFHELGIRQKDTVALMLRNSHAFIEAWLAAGILGAYSVPINWHFNVEEARYIFDDSDAKVLVIHADLNKDSTGVPFDVIRGLGADDVIAIVDDVTTSGWRLSRYQEHLRNREVAPGLYGPQFRPMGCLVNLGVIYQD